MAENRKKSKLLPWILWMIVLVAIFTQMISAAILGTTFYNYKVLKENYCTDEDYEILADKMNNQLENVLKDEGVIIECTDVFQKEFVRYMVGYMLDCHYKGTMGEIDMGYLRDYIDTNILPTYMHMPGASAIGPMQYGNELLEEYAGILETKEAEIKESQVYNIYNLKSAMQKAVIVIGLIVIVLIFRHLYYRNWSFWQLVQLMGFSLSLSCVLMYISVLNVDSFIGRQGVYNVKLVSEEAELLTYNMTEIVYKNFQVLLDKSHIYIIMGMILGVVLYVGSGLLRILKPKKKTVTRKKVVNNAYDELDTYIPLDVPMGNEYFITTDTKPGEDVAEYSELLIRGRSNNTENVSSNENIVSGKEISDIIKLTEDKVQDTDTVYKRTDKTESYEDFISMFPGYDGQNVEL